MKKMSNMKRLSRDFFYRLGMIIGHKNTFFTQSFNKLVLTREYPSTTRDSDTPIDPSKPGYDL